MFVTVTWKWLEVSLAVKTPCGSGQVSGVFLRFPDKSGQASRAFRPPHGTSGKR